MIRRLSQRLPALPIPDVWCFLRRSRKKHHNKGHGAASHVSEGCPPQQVSPVLCAAFARQKTHAVACNSFAVGSGVFRRSRKTPDPTRMGSVREPGSRMHPQVALFCRIHRFVHLRKWTKSRQAVRTAGDTCNTGRCLVLPDTYLCYNRKR
jgi:hypothetical protein